MEEVYRSFYTKSEAIVSYMIRMLSVEDGNKIFEPCAGDGVFVDELINQKKTISIDIYEINPEAFRFLKEKYKSIDFITITLGDTLINKELIYFSVFFTVVENYFVFSLYFVSFLFPFSYSV